MNISKTFPRMLGFYNSLARDLVPKHASGFLAFFPLSLLDKDPDSYCFRNYSLYELAILQHSHSS